METGRHTGFALTEALVALLIVAGGMLGLVQLQALLVRNNDLAAQRTEATQLARECIENLRSLRNHADWIGLPGNRCPASLNGRSANYSRAVILGGISGDSLRATRVTVSWTDREGAAQSVRLFSYLANADPVDAGMLAFPLAQSVQLRGPKERNVNIPVNALDLGEGRSSVQLGANYAAILDNVTGAVVRHCNPGVANATRNDILGSSCEAMPGYLLSGYIVRGSSVSDAEWSSIQGGLGINHAGVERNAAGSRGISCLTSNVSALSTSNKGYLCVIPLSSPNLWSGTVRVGGPDALRTGSLFVCRYQYLQGSLQAFERNEQPYANVGQSFDQQNYLIASGNATATCPSSMNLDNVSLGVLHQDCRAGNVNRATDCPPPS